MGKPSPAKLANFLEVQLLSRHPKYWMFLYMPLLPKLRFRIAKSVDCVICDRLPGFDHISSVQCPWKPRRSSFTLHEGTARRIHQ
ncbi:hypothetical protein MKW92_044058 [Papaver armeniacum]|nr:hypothetical protein MKW92_044058 [Papaver armeniacum]